MWTIEAKAKAMSSKYIDITLRDARDSFTHAASWQDEDDVQFKKHCWDTLTKLDLNYQLP